MKKSKVYYSPFNETVIIFHGYKNDIELVFGQPLIVNSKDAWIEDEYGLFIMVGCIFENYIEIGDF